MYPITAIIFCSIISQALDQTLLRFDFKFYHVFFQAGDEKGRIERPGGTNTPIYGVAWNPAVAGNSDTLCVIDWGQVISFFTLGGQAIGKERSLGFDPLSVMYFPDGEFLTVAGCNKAMQLFTKEGIRLGLLGEQHESWIWSTAVHPSGSSIVTFC